MKTPCTPGSAVGGYARAERRAVLMTLRMPHLPWSSSNDQIWTIENEGDVVRFCGNCGASLEQDGRFCESYGAKGAVGRLSRHIAVSAPTWYPQQADSTLPRRP
jgi:hypothetical protein